MPRQIVINVGGSSVLAELLEQAAPNISNRMWEILPLDSFSVHAKFAGQEIIIMVPFYTEPENEILNVKPGDIGYYPGRQTICIFYGDTTPFGHVSVFARIGAGQGDLRATGDRLLRAGILPARLERAQI